MHLLRKLARLLLARLPQARSVGHGLLQRILQLVHRGVLLRAAPRERLLLRQRGLPCERRGRVKGESAACRQGLAIRVGRRRLKQRIARGERLLELGDRAPEDAQLARIPLPIPLSGGGAAGGGGVGAGRHRRGWLHRRGKLPDKGSRRLLEG